MTGFGLCVLDPGGKKILRIRRYKTEPVPKFEGLKVPKMGQLASDRFRGSDEERIDWLARKCVQAVKKYDVCFAVIEDHAFGAQGRGKTVLAELQGVIKHYLLKNEVAFVTKAPTSIKKHITGNGRAEKIDIIYAAKAAGHDISDSDRADAWACAMFGRDNYKDLVWGDEEEE